MVGLRRNFNELVRGGEKKNRQKRKYKQKKPKKRKRRNKQKRSKPIDDEGPYISPRPMESINEGAAYQPRTVKFKTHMIGAHEKALKSVRKMDQKARRGLLEYINEGDKK